MPLYVVQVTAVDPAIDAALGLLEQFADKARKGAIDSNRLQHGAPWRDFPRNDNKERRQQWARIQLMDFVQAFTDTEFGVQYQNFLRLCIILSDTFVPVSQHFD